METSPRNFWRSIENMASHYRPVGGLINGVFRKARTSDACWWIILAGWN